VADGVVDSYQDDIPELLTVVSFRRIVWMVEKSGAKMSDIIPGSPAIRNRVMLRCAQNIARWWLVEYNKCEVGNNRISFLGEVSMHCGLMPVALWLGVSEYGGVWRHSGGKSQYRDEEQLGGIGDNCMSALSDALSVYGLSTASGSVLRPAWYRDRFVEWAEEMANMMVLPNLRNHNSVLRTSWCGLVGCPYPYVTERILVPIPTIPGPQIVKEDPSLGHVYKHMLYPRWGASLQDSATSQVEMEEGREDDNDYSPMSSE